jgi:hypothetical protein
MGLGSRSNLGREVHVNLHPTALGKALDIPLRSATESSFIQARRMKQVGCCTNFLQRLVRQLGYSGKLFDDSFVFLQSLLQQRDGDLLEP